MHRNLILDISFLPIESPQDGEHIQPSAENVVVESYMSELSDLKTGVLMLEWRHGCVIDRMKVKVKNLGKVMFLESDYSTQSRGSVCEQMSDIETKSPANSTNPQTQTVNGSHANGMPKTQAQTSADTQDVKTCAGRVVRRVSRLIESMAQRPFYVQRVGSSLAKKSGSILSLF